MLRQRLAAAALVAMVLAAVTAAFFVPCVNGVPNAYDLDVHVAMTVQFKAAQDAGIAYPRWVDLMNDGWGAPTLVYYPPILYYTAAGATALAGDVVTGLYLALAMATFIGALGVFFLARPLAGAWGACAAATLYVVMPFRAFEFYASGLYAAYFACAFIPWAWLALAATTTPNPVGAHRRAAVGLAWCLSYALIVLTNLPAAVLFACLAGAWAVFESARERSARPLLLTAAGGVGGVLLAAVYLVPALAEMPSMQVPHAADDPHMFRSNFVFQGSGSWMSPGLWWLFTRMGAYPTLLLAVGGGVLWLWRGERRGLFRLVLVQGLVAIFLTTSLSKPLWELLPFLRHVTLPWRLLDPAGAAAAVLGGAAIATLLSKLRGAPLATGWRPGLAAVAIFGLVAVGVVTWHRAATTNGFVTMDQAVESGRRHCAGEAFFSPAGALPPDQMPTDDMVQLSLWAPSVREFEAEAEDTVEVKVRTYWFPGWRATSDGRELVTRPEPGTGRMCIEVPPGRHTVRLEFGRTPLRTAALVTSVVAWTLWLAAAAWLTWRLTKKP